MKYKFRYRNKFLSIAYDIFSIFAQSIIGSVLLYALSNLIISFTPLIDIEVLDPLSKPYYTAFIIIFALSFLILIFIYVKADKTVHIEDDAITINFGHHDFVKYGWYGYNVRFDFDKIKSLDISPADDNGKLEFRVTGGDYKNDYIRILYNDDNNYLLPLDSDAISIITEKYNSVNQK